MTKYEILQQLIAIDTDECIIWPHAKNVKGYGSVKVNGKDRGAHIIALELTTPRPPGKVCAIHGNYVEGDKLHAAHGECHNPLCINPRHLSWKTNSENQADKKRDGTDPVGERNGNCSIPEDIVEAIKSEYKGKQHRYRPKTGPTTYELADKYGCSQRQVRNIVNGKSRSVSA